MIHLMNVNHHFVNLWACECVYGIFSVYINDFWGRDMWYEVVADFSFARPFPNSLFRAYWSFKKKTSSHCDHFLGGGFKCFYFHLYLGKWSSLTNIFQMGWNHQLGDHFHWKNMHFMSVWYHFCWLVIWLFLSSNPKEEEVWRYWTADGSEIWRFAPVEIDSLSH